MIQAPPVTPFIILKGGTGTPGDPGGRATVGSEVQFLEFYKRLVLELGALGRGNSRAYRSSFVSPTLGRSNPQTSKIES